MLRKMIGYFKKVARFEQVWLDKVRLEIYFNGLQQEIVEAMRQNVKYERAAKVVMTRRKFLFIHQLKKMADRTHVKWTDVRTRFKRRQGRALIRVLKENIKIQKRKRECARLAKEMRTRILLKLGFSKILALKKARDEIKIDKILQKIHNKEDHEEFFSV